MTRVFRQKFLHHCYRNSQKPRKCKAVHFWEEQKLLMFQDKRSLLSRNIFRSSEACLETGGRHFETLLWKYFQLNLRGMTLQRQLPCWREIPVRCSSSDVENTHAEKRARWEHRVRGRTVFRRTEGTQVCLSTARHRTVLIICCGGTEDLLV